MRNKGAGGGPSVVAGEGSDACNEAVLSAKVPATVCVLILLDLMRVMKLCYLLRYPLYMCPHTALYVLSSYYYMCPHTTIYVSSYYICVLILVYLWPLS